MLVCAINANVEQSLKVYSACSNLYYSMQVAQAMHIRR